MQGGSCTNIHPRVARHTIHAASGFDQPSCWADIALGKISSAGKIGPALSGKTRRVFFVGAAAGLLVVSAAGGSAAVLAEQADHAISSRRVREQPDFDDFCKAVVAAA